MIRKNHDILMFVKTKHDQHGKSHVFLHKNDLIVTQTMINNVPEMCLEKLNGEKGQV